MVARATSPTMEERRVQAREAALADTLAAIQILETLSDALKHEATALELVRIAGAMPRRAMALKLALGDVVRYG